MEKPIIGTTGKICDPRGINSPYHYNNHESGVEAIEVCRYMNFNVGSAFKYVYRRGDKVETGMTLGQAIQKDLDKALWYLNDEAGWFAPRESVGWGVATTGAVVALARIIAAETNPVAKAVYESFQNLNDAKYQSAYMLALIAVEKALVALKEYERSAV